MAKAWGFVSLVSGDWGCGAMMCRLGFLLDGAFRSHLLRGGGVVLPSWTGEWVVVESACSSLGRRMGTNADLTTSICSSSESSESCRSMDEFSLWCDEDVGLLELGLDEETGERRDDSVAKLCGGRE